MRHLILFLFATLVFMLATPMSGSAELVSDEITIKPPGDSNFIIEITSEISVFSTTDYASVPTCTSLLKFPIYLGYSMAHGAILSYSSYKYYHNAISICHIINQPKSSMDIKYSMARICSFMQSANMI